MTEQTNEGRVPLHHVAQGAISYLHHEVAPNISFDDKGAPWWHTLRSIGLCAIILKLKHNSSGIEQMIANHPMVKLGGMLDEAGTMDVEAESKVLIEAIESSPDKALVLKDVDILGQKLGTLTFTREDVEVLKGHILREAGLSAAQ